MTRRLIWLLVTLALFGLLVSHELRAGSTGGRYPSQEAYVQLVRSVAAALLADRFLLQEDSDAYLQAAHRWRESHGSANATRAQ